MTVQLRARPAFAEDHVQFPTPTIRQLTAACNSWPLWAPAHRDTDKQTHIQHINKQMIDG